MYQIEDSHRWLDIIDMQIKNCQIQLHFLENNKPFWFQKKKLTEYNEKTSELENKINKYYQDLNEEVEMIFKLQKSLNKEGIIISYSKLVELLKYDNAPIEVELELNNQKKCYVLSEDGYYVLKNKNEENDVFSYWLRDCLLDAENDTKCIKIIKYKYYLSEFKSY